MKNRFLLVVLLVLITFLTKPVQAFDVRTNHTGFFFYGMGGMMLLDHDTNVDNGIPFGNDIEPGFGLGLGYNITNWIAPELQIAYSTSTGQTSGGQGREHALNI